MQRHIAGIINEFLIKNNMAASELSHMTGVSAATISKLRRGTHAETASFHIMLKISNFMGISVSEFAPKNKMEQKFLPIEFIDDAFSENNNVYLDFFSLSIGGECLYICDTIPEFLKTPQILKAELGDRPSLMAYGQKMKDIKSNLHAVEKTYGAIFIDKKVIEDIIDRNSVYSELSISEVDQQISTLINFFESVFPRIHGYIVDFRRNDLDTCFVVNQSVGVQFVFGGYLKWKSNKLGKSIHEKSIQAINNSVSVLQFLRKHIY